MTWIIIKQPHPLDAIWSQAMAAVEVAQDAIDALPDDYTNEEIDVLVDKHSDAARAVLALPARGIADCITKLDLTGPLDCGQIVWADRNAIVSEMLTLHDAATERGSVLLKAMPDLLEGVPL